MDESTELPVKPPRRRRWLSYSLRTLLLLTAIVAAIMAVWVNRAERQRRAVAAIRDLGGEVRYDFEWSGNGIVPQVLRPPGLHSILGIDYCANVVFVDMPPSTTDAGLVHVSALKHLKELQIQKSQITDAGLAHLSVLTNLQVLYLSTKVTDAGLVYLAGSRISAFSALLVPRSPMPGSCS